MMIRALDLSVTNVISQIVTWERPLQCLKWELITLPGG